MSSSTELLPPPPNPAENLGKEKQSLSPTFFLLLFQLLLGKHYHHEDQGKQHLEKKFSTASSTKELRIIPCHQHESQPHPHLPPLPGVLPHTLAAVPAAAGANEATGVPKAAAADDALGSFPKRKQNNSFLYCICNCFFT